MRDGVRHRLRLAQVHHRHLRARHPAAGQALRLVADQARQARAARLVAHHRQVADQVLVARRRVVVHRHLAGALHRVAEAALHHLECRYDTARNSRILFRLIDPAV